MISVLNDFTHNGNTDKVFNSFNGETAANKWKWEISMVCMRRVWNVNGWSCELET